MPKTIRFWRRSLPHWEVENGCYFVTIRCVGSLPKLAVARLATIRQELDSVEDLTAGFVEHQRRYFLALEDFLDRLDGFSPFSSRAAVEVAHETLQQSCDADGWCLGDVVWMPNHVHWIVGPGEFAKVDLEHFLKRAKARIALRLNRYLARSGRFWQGEWFDRWARSAPELRKIETYIENNPEKAGLVSGVDKAGFFGLYRQQWKWRMDGEELKQ